jgi:membrane-bound acyltransferase YfiQ involved in biofilm formation
VSTGYVNKLLSCKFLYPLSRISYCAYLVHPVIMISVIMHMDSPMHLGRASMVSDSHSLVDVTALKNTTTPDNITQCIM